MLDGEIVAFGESGWPSFEALQHADARAADAPAAQRLVAEYPVTYLAFDLLHLDGRPLLDLPYTAAPDAARGAGAARPVVADAALVHRGGRAPTCWRLSVQHGLEGIVAKRLDSRYEPGEAAGRLAQGQEHPAARRRWSAAGSPGKGSRAGQIGSLLVGVQDADGLAYAGHVGTGFTDQVAAPARPRGSPRCAGPPRRSPRRCPPDHARDAVWAEPVLVAEVAFTGWTRAGRMRAPSYRGLRADKDPAEVIREP